MSLVEEYYELNEAEEVSAIWKVLQIGLYGLAGVIGLCCGFTLANLRLKFDDRCYLFTEVKVLQGNFEIDENDINWESDTWCDYYQFSLVSSFIVGIIWGTLYLMCGKGGKSVTGLPQPWRIVWPSLIFNFIYFVIILSTAVSIQQGTDNFCGRDNFEKKNPTKSFLDRCEVLKLVVKKDLHWTAFQMEIVARTSWGCVLCWLSLFLLSLLRIVFVVDFDVYKICVFKIDDTVRNKKEEVLRITNYEEPKKLYFEKTDETEIPGPKNNPKEEPDADTRKRAKVEKKQMRYFLHTTSLPPLKSNAVFYETADIRMLNRDKKRQKSSKALDDAFGITEMRTQQMKPDEVESDSDTSINSEMPDFLSKYSDELFNNEENEDKDSSSSQRIDFNDDWNETGSGSENIATNFDTNGYLRLKKRI